MGNETFYGDGRTRENLGGSVPLGSPNLNPILDQENRGVDDLDKSHEQWKISGCQRDFSG